MIKLPYKSNTMISQNKQSIKVPQQSNNQFIEKLETKNKNNNQKIDRGVWDQQTSEGKYDEINSNLKAQFQETFNKLDNQKLGRNTFIFGILLLLAQVGICLVYGFQIITYRISVANTNFIYFKQSNAEHNKLNVKDVHIPDLTPLFMNIFTIFVVVVGFGLLFTYNKKLVWSAIGFHLFICCFTVQIYFIFNNLINQIGINPGLKPYSEYWRIYLWNYQYDTVDQKSIDLLHYIKLYGNTLLDAFKCGLANSIAFSAIRGKAGLLEAFFVVIVGTAGYQFSRQILASKGIDFGESNSIFTFGGFYGFTLAFIKFIRSKIRKQPPVKTIRFYQANLNSVTFSLIGLGILVSFLPILAAHPTPKQYLYFSQSFSIAPYSIYHSMAAGAMMSLACSFLFHGKASIREFINGTIASGIAILCSSYYIYNPGFALVIGLFSATAQALLQMLVESWLIDIADLITTYSFTLFGVQGIIGAAAGSIFKAVMLSSNQLSYSRDSIKNTWQPIALGLISAGIGVGVGLIVGIIISFFDFHRPSDYFHDKTYWKDQQQVFNQQQDQFENWQDLWQKLIPQLMPEA